MMRIIWKVDEEPPQPAEVNSRLVDHSRRDGVVSREGPACLDPDDLIEIGVEIADDLLLRLVRDSECSEVHGITIEVAADPGTFEIHVDPELSEDGNGLDFWEPTGSGSLVVECTVVAD